MLKWVGGALAFGAVAWVAAGLGSGASARGNASGSRPDCAESVPASAGSGVMCKRPATAAAPAATPAGAPAAEPAQARTLVEVVSRSCSACRRMEPVMEKVTRRCASDALKVEQRYVDDDEGAAYARRHAVFGVPTFLLLDEGGREVSRLVGEQPLAVLEGAMRDFSGGRCGS